MNLFCGKENVRQKVQINMKKNFATSILKKNTSQRNIVLTVNCVEDSIRIRTSLFVSHFHLCELYYFEIASFVGYGVILSTFIEGRYGWASVATMGPKRWQREQASATPGAQLQTTNVEHQTLNTDHPKLNAIKRTKVYVLCLTRVDFQYSVYQGTFRARCKCQIKLTSYTIHSYTVHFIIILFARNYNKICIICLDISTSRQY